jgi:hypothetical protein
VPKKEEPPQKMGLASSAGAFPLAVIDDSVRCATPECSHVNHLALVRRVRLRCLAARETSVVSSDLTTRTSFRTFEVPRYDDVSPERIRFRKPVTEAEGEYIAADVLVKENFSTTFS